MPLLPIATEGRCRSQVDANALDARLDVLGDFHLVGASQTVAPTPIATSIAADNGRLCGRRLARRIIHTGQL